MARTIAIILVIASRVHAEITLPKVLGDNMVLQRNQPVPIWGHAAGGEQVQVQFAGQTQSAAADASGNWKISLDAMPASNEPGDMTISGSNSITLKNILIGEVWLCGGQSNMEFPMQPVGNFSSKVHVLPQLTDALAASKNSEIRLFKVEKRLSTPDVTTSGWKECAPDSADKFSAVGYFFGKELHDQLKVPIGMMQSCWAGTRIEPWTPPEAYEQMPVFQSQATTKPVNIDGARAGTHFNAMIRPLAPYAIRGVIWYQGESNVINNDGLIYVDKMKALIGSWRSTWNQGDFPFYYVQLAPLYYSKRKDPKPHNEQELPLGWEAQVKSLRIPNSAMAGTMDLVENFTDIHPADKSTVAHRLALIAMAKTYGQKDLVYSGPMFKSVSFEDGKARISFDFTAGALASRDGKPLSEFTIAGADGRFVPANATIDGETIIVSSPSVTSPKIVRFAWNESAQPNLINKAGLPAIPFRTDAPADN
ncbi:MAG TPA: sialate O-acetylesterase [Tepidisphaeraceae bacterium]|nr:sialate O-acetylesterase [Tepidisphaeraceae bacterium]